MHNISHTFFEHLMDNSEVKRYNIEVKEENLFKSILSKLDKDVYDFIQNENKEQENRAWFKKKKLLT